MPLWGVTSGMGRAPKISDLTNLAPLWVRLTVIGFVIAALVLVVSTHQLLTRRFTELTRSESQLTAALYSGNLVSRLERQSLVPLLLSRDPVLISALQSRDYQSTSQRLIAFSAEIGAASIDLLDLDGVVVAASERRALGANLSEQPYFVAALRDNGTVFTVTGLAEGENRPGFQYARKVIASGDSKAVGVVVVHVDLLALEALWRWRNDKVVVANSEDKVILASNPFWRRRALPEVLNKVYEPSILGKTWNLLTGEKDIEPDVKLDGQLHLRTETKTGFRGWRLTYLADTGDVRSKVYGYIALEVLVLALILLGLLYLVNKRLQRKSLEIVQESDRLRELNTRLSQEIEDRRRIQRDLKSAEQSLEQASKLAALGEMSAAISHELNQPLAAMRTYLAGARLLLTRKRPDEALTSFHRIEDLLDRMGSITRQLKSFARKGTDDLIPVDMRDAVEGSLAMMTPQLRDSDVDMRKILPPGPVMVEADPVRLDQIIVNLLRNALDAVEHEPAPAIEILVTQGSQVSLTVRDNGIGIEDADSLFEPFYTTKPPGEGVGLGLAISAGIAKELGGHLTARHADPKGAVFELQLPTYEGQADQAAE